MKRFFLGLLFSVSAWGYDYLLFDGDKYYFTEVVDTAESRQKGLMYRYYVPSFATMLFVFERPQVLTFWMKNTPTPLDIRFYDENGNLVKAHQNVPTCYRLPCPTYSSEKKALLVMEVRAGISRPSQQIQWIRPLKK